MGQKFCIAVIQATNTMPKPEASIRNGLLIRDCFKYIVTFYTFFTGTPARIKIGLWRVWVHFRNCSTLKFNELARFFSCFLGQWRFISLQTSEVINDVCKDCNLYLACVGTTVQVCYFERRLVSSSGTLIDDEFLESIS